MRNLFLLLLLNISIVNAQRQRYDGYMPTTGDSHTQVPYGGTKDAWQNANNNNPINSSGYYFDIITNNLLKHLKSYPIVNFKPQTNISGIVNIPGIQSIRIIDGRFDVKKVGFFPCDRSFQERSLYMVGLQLQNNLPNWLKESFIEKNILIDTNDITKRQLVILVKEFWYSIAAIGSPSDSKSRLTSNLHYRFDIFSSKDVGYYPIKRLEGSFTTNLNNNKSYNTLTDSVIVLLKDQFTKFRFEANEIESKWIAPADFVDYCNKDFKRLRDFEKKNKGLYENYEDFLENNPMADSVEMIKKYTNSGTTILYACEIAAYQNKEPRSGTKAWGYFDGETIYLNTGSGLYIKLIRSDGDYLFLFLKNLGNDKINAAIRSSIIINETPYQILKKFSRSYSLIYQLNYTSGKLF